MSSKTVLLVGDRHPRSGEELHEYYGHGHLPDGANVTPKEASALFLFGALHNEDELIVKRMGNDDNSDKLRGYNADIVMVNASLSTMIVRRILQPMVALGGSIIWLNDGE